MPTPESITPKRAERLRDVLEHRQPNLTVVFENVDDPHNVSAVIRSCDAVGVMEVHGVYPDQSRFPKLGAKSSASARKWVDTHFHTSIKDCYKILRDRGFKIYTTHMSSDAVSLYDLNLAEPVALVFGNEHSGVSEEARLSADGNFLIPQVGMIKSLNISVACAVSLFEAYRQRQKAGMYEEAQIAPERLEALSQDWFSK